MTDVLVLHATVRRPGDAHGAAALLARLPYARRLELERRTPQARAASLLGTALVLAGAGRLRGAPVAASELTYRSGSAPALLGGPWFSVSHSPTRVAVALSLRAPVGLDIEDAAAAPAASGTFAGSLERWTATEATLKASGAGLRAAREVWFAHDLSRAEVDGMQFWLRPLGIAADCAAFLATPIEVASVAVEEVADPW